MNTLKDKLIAQLRAEEGEILHAYSDSVGLLSIGVGRLIDKRKGGGITQQEAEYLLKNDIDRCQSDLDRRLPWWRDMSESRQAVIVGMAFQLGIDGLMSFKNTLAMMQKGDYAGASDGMMASLWAKQTPARARRMSEQMKTGEWKWK